MHATSHSLSFAAGHTVLVLPDNKRVLLVSDGARGATLAAQLLQQSPDAEITLLAPFFSTALKQLAVQHSQLTLVQKTYHTTDLIDVQLVIAATSYTDLVEQLRHDCVEHNLLFSIASETEEQLPAPATLHRVQNVVQGSERNWKRIATLLIIAFGLMLGGHIMLSYLPLPPVRDLLTATAELFGGSFGVFVLTGFFAQLIDGALGMGYGLVSATCLLTAGVNPVSISAAIHTSEVFTSGISGYSHYRFGNVNRKLFRHLVFPGVLGAIAGAVGLVLLGQHAGSWLMPLLSGYAFFLGIRILLRAFQLSKPQRKVKRIGWLAAAGGFFDSFGGGGWGPLVTSTLLAGGRSPRYTIGSVSLTEFFVTLTSAITFFALAGTGHWPVIAGLLLGGAAASPIAVRLAGKLPARTLLIAVGILVMAWSVRIMIKAFL
ncbi:MAG: TSUP family transporter [Bacteroidetes bacterium]|nr:TSUP family transporter [Bacteroidota bacterium]